MRQAISGGPPFDFSKCTTSSNNPAVYQPHYHSWVEKYLVKRMEIISFCHSKDKTDEEKEPDAPAHEQKESSECEEIMNYPGYRTSSGDFYF